MNASPPPWFTLADAAEVSSPALLIYPQRVEENVRRMIALAGSPARLRPHMKTHKMPALIQLQRDAGITRFKCATIAEAEMTAQAGAPDVLFAYQPVGPNLGRLLELQKRFPGTSFSTIADDVVVLRALAQAARAAGTRLTVLLDVDCGQHRCGVEPGRAALDLYTLLASSPGLIAGGLHVYDGHLHESDVAVRTQKCTEAFAPVLTFREQLISAGMPVPRLVAGGTPTFPMHARRTEAGIECSPGTCVLWDAGYATRLPDMDFLVAAALLTRVVSKPGDHRLCLDLGHKAVASEMPHPRVHFPQLPDAKAVTHSEEHLVIETSHAGAYAVGDCLYGIPWHICPTVALHSSAVVVRDAHAVNRWPVSARERTLTI